MDVCSLCCDESRSWAVGSCDHSTCLLCSVRLRVLCDQKDCPVCREKLNKVVVSDSVKCFSLPPRGCKVDKKYGYLFESPQLFDRYKTLQECRCTKCQDRPVFDKFTLLRDHARKVHGLLYCDICCDNLKLFPHELRQYSRQELTRHRRDGDPDNSSYKGHPLCQFCDERFFDNDALHTHLRKVHFWCHFCESDGKQDYYSAYPLLRKHFREDHYLCEEGACQHEKLTSVFRTKLDLQVHRAKVHSKGATKAEAKQMRQLDVGFSYGSRATDDRSGGGGGGALTAGGRGQWQQVQQRSNRQSKTRDRELYEDRLSAGSSNVQPPQTRDQRETESPPVSKGRKQKPSVAETSNGGQYTNEQPPRLRQKQQQKQTVKSTTTSMPPVSSETARNKLNSTSKTKSSSKPPATKPSSLPPATKPTSRTKPPENKVSQPTSMPPAGGGQGIKPPGFDSSLQQQTNSTVKVDAAAGRGEWPDLTALTTPKPVTEPPKLQPTRITYNPLEPSGFPVNFPPLLNTNKNLPPPAGAPQMERSRASLSAAVASSLNGVNGPSWQSIQHDSIYNTSSLSNPSSAPSISAPGQAPIPREVTEGSVISLVREALDNDREKFNRFRNLSGWYRNSEITVQEYVLRCRDLFGDMNWIKIAQQLARVMPIESKRNELLQNIYIGMNDLQQSPGASLGDYFTTQLNLSSSSSSHPMPPGISTMPPQHPMHMSRSEPSLLQSAGAIGATGAKWGVLSNRVVPSLGSVLEYPSLNTSGVPPSSVVVGGGVRRQSQPPGLSSHHTWKSRVPV